MNYNIGLCSLELKNYLQAHDAFNSAIEVDKRYPEAYYQRGERNKSVCLSGI